MATITSLQNSYDKTITTVNYETDNGSQIQLSAETVRNYLVNGGGNVTDQEVMMFLELCKYQRINPFLREAYLIKYGNSPAQTVTGKELFTKRAEAHPDFDGYRAGIVVLTKDEQIIEREGAMFLSQLGEILVGGWAEVFRKNQKVPTKGMASFTEYSTGKSMWQKMPATMIRKVALVQCLREAFPNILGGLYSQEEMPVDASALPITPVVMPSNEEKPQQFYEEPQQNIQEAELIENKEEKIITKAQGQRMYAIALKREDLCKEAMQAYGYSKSTEIKRKHYDAIIKYIENKLREENGLEEMSNPFEDGKAVSNAEIEAALKTAGDISIAELDISMDEMMRD